MMTSWNPERDRALHQMNAGVLDRKIFMGVDLGQRENHSAIVVLERFETMPDYTDRLRGKGAFLRYVVRQAERIDLGTPYSDVVGRIKEMVTMLEGQRYAVVVDESGVGVPVVEMLRKTIPRSSILAYTITTGAHATRDTVPRAELVTRMVLMAEQGELEIAWGCRHGDELLKELAHLQLSGKSKEAGDDLALALALACWKAKGW
jgi:hypothetical protein